MNIFQTLDCSWQDDLVWQNLQYVTIAYIYIISFFQEEIQV